MKQQRYLYRIRACLAERFHASGWDFRPKSPPERQSAANCSARQLWAKIEICHDLLPLSHLLLFIFEREAAVERLRPQNLESGVAQLAERGRRHQGFDGSNLAVNAVLARAAAARDDEHRLPAPQEALRVDYVQVARPADAEEALVAGAENRRQTVVPHRTD